jgi:1-deoxy-D-xylulose-5-phosphate synthase
MYTAQLEPTGPFAIRYPRGKGHIIDWKQDMKKVQIGKGEMIKHGTDLAILTIGTVAHPASKAILRAEAEISISIAHYDLRFVKPLDTELLHNIAQKYNYIITIEDGVIDGGFGSAILEFMSDNQYQPNIIRMGINDTYVEHGTPEQLYALLGLDENGIFDKIFKLSKKFSLVH